jgi:sialate O-acetylesterase
MNIKHYVLSAVLASSIPLGGFCDVRISALFADNMVIQRETQAPVWGWAEAGEKVTVTGSWGASASTTTDDAGRWMVKRRR